MRDNWAWTRFWSCAAGWSPTRRPGRRRSGSRRPASRETCRTSCSCSSTRPSTPRAAAPSRASWAWARTGTGCRESRSARPTAAAGSPTTAPVSWSGYPIVSLKPYGDNVHEYVRGLERLMIESLAAYGVEAEVIDGLTGVWVGGRPPEGRKIGSIGVHVNRGVTTHGFAVNVNNDLQPFEWIVPCGIEGVRMTSLCRELGAEQDMDPVHGPGQRALRGDLRARAGRGRGNADGSGWRGGLGTVGAMADRRSPPRHPLPRQPRGQGAGRGGQGRLPLPQAALAQGSRARRPDLPPPEEGDRDRQPAHRLPGGQLPERRRVLGARHGDLHDPRRRLHPPLRLLQRPDRQADLARPARAAARREPGQADGPAPRGDHLGRPRRSPRLRGRRVRGRDPLDPPDGARVQGRGAHPGLPRPGDAARQGDRRAARTSSTTTSRPSRGSTRSPGAARTSCARRGSCGWRRRWPATRWSPSPG